MTLSRRLISAVALLCATGALAACGDDDDSSGGSSAAPSNSGETLSLKAEEPSDTKYVFDPSSLTAKSGSVKITLDNPDGNSQPHAIEVEGNGVEEESDIISPGGSGDLTVDLKPGKYEFYCPVGNHRELGMEGTLTVN